MPNTPGETTYQRHNLVTASDKAVELWQAYLYDLSKRNPGKTMAFLEQSVAEEVLSHATPHSLYLTDFAVYVATKHHISVQLLWHDPNGNGPIPGTAWPGAKFGSWIYRYNSRKMGIICHGNHQLLTRNDKLRANCLLLHELWHLIDPKALVQYSKSPDDTYIASLDPELEPRAWCFSYAVLMQIVSARGISGRLRSGGTILSHDPTGLDVYPEWPKHAGFAGSP